MDYRQFYKDHRCREADLYPSERAILGRLDLRRKRILDVGCACAGFYGVFREISRDVRYDGIDVSPEMIASAKNRFPEIAEHLHVGTGSRMPFFKDRQFDIVFCSSVQAHCRDYRGLFRECWRLTREALIFDFRFSLDGTTRDLAERGGDFPYIVVHAPEVFRLISGLPGLRKIALESYEIAPNRNRTKEAKVSARRTRVWCGLFLMER